MKKLLILIIALVSLWACEDKEQPLPTPQPYINKFNCKINGKYWEVIPKGLNRPLRNNTLMINFDIIKEDTIMDILAENIELNDGIRLGFILTSDTTKTFNWHKNPYYNYERSTTCGNYYIDSTKTNKVLINSLNPKERIIKGRFQFDVVSQNCKDTIHITDGYFDVNY